MTGPTLELFRCVPLEVRLTRRACGDRHARAKKEVRREAPKGQHHLVGNQRCAECPVGATHLAGGEARTWPDGDRVETSAPLTPEPGSSMWTTPKTTSSSSEARPDRREGTPPIPDVGPTAPRGASSPRPPVDVPEVVVTVRPKPPAEPAEEGSKKMGQRGETFTHGGRSLTAYAWSQVPEVKALGLSGQAIRSRIKAGWSVADALTTAKGDPRPGGAPTKPAKRAKRAAKNRKPAAKPKPVSYADAVFAGPPAAFPSGADLEVIVRAAGVEVARSEDDPATWRAALALVREAG